ncbi:MAG TPA: DUF222 domain-containing protein [Candidatus Nanopelagicales bacterium]|nr:DUF222 domain-containing protein [Candidatus Nanopelagicales bacterium]
MFDTDAVAVPGASAAALLESTDPTELSDLDLVAYAQAAERQVAHATALSLQASLLVAERAATRVLGEIDQANQDRRRPPSATRVELAHRAGVHEVQQALRLSTTAATNRLHRAGALAGALAPAGAALRTGAISFTHLLVLLDHTLGLDQDLTTALQTRCLPRAPRQTPGDFGRSLTRARHALDPDGTAAAHRAARTDTGVRKADAADGMAALVITATDPDAEWAYTVLDTLARARLHHLGTTDDDGVLRTPPAAGAASPTLDQLRAEVFFCLLQRAVTDPAFPTAHGKRRVETQVVLTLDTLLGLRQDPGTINGRSVPADIARALASGTTALRRLVTDPVRGHLLDYGTAREPPADLVEFLLARDGECRVPHCRIRASACDLDHAVPRTQRGPTSSTNMGALSRGHHTPKTNGWTDIIESSADGSATYVSILGQRIPIPPRPVLGDPAPEQPEVSQPDFDREPPF